MKKEQKIFLGLFCTVKYLEFQVSDYSKSDHSLHNYPGEAAQH